MIATPEIAVAIADRLKSLGATILLSDAGEAYCSSPVGQPYGEPPVHPFHRGQMRGTVDALWALVQDVPGLGEIVAAQAAS